MVDRTAQFFNQLEQQAPNSLPPAFGGTIRFDLDADGEIRHWFVAIKRGDVLVSRENREADCVVATEQLLFDRIVTGESQVIAAYNRNEMTVQGNLRLLFVFRRVFPSPPGTRDPRERVRERFGDRAAQRRRRG